LTYGISPNVYIFVSDLAISISSHYTSLLLN